MGILLFSHTDFSTLEVNEMSDLHLIGFESSFIHKNKVAMGQYRWESIEWSGYFGKPSALETRERSLEEISKKELI